MYMKLKNILNKIVSMERKNGSLFELGEFVDMAINQKIPYVRLKNTVDNIRKWKLNSLKFILQPIHFKVFNHN